MTADLRGLYRNGLVSSLTPTYLQTLVNADYVLNDLPMVRRASDKKPILILHRVADLRSECLLAFHDPFFMKGVENVGSVLKPEPSDIDIPFVRADRTGLPLYSVCYTGFIIDGCDACMSEACHYPRSKL